MSARDDLNRYVRLLDSLTGVDKPSRGLVHARAIQRIDDGNDAAAVAAEFGIHQRHLLVWHRVVVTEGLTGWLGKKIPTADRLRKARAGIAQMLLGLLAEEHFEALSADLVGGGGFRLEDQRVGRTDTDYRLVDPDARPICRLNIKFHGTLFKRAQEHVGLEPHDCFALATYKIYGALQRQEQERLPYVFLIISVPDFPRDLIEPHVSDDWAGSRHYPVGPSKSELPPPLRGNHGRTQCASEFDKPSSASSRPVVRTNC